MWVWVCAGVCGCVRVCAGVCGCVHVCAGVQVVVGGFVQVCRCVGVKVGLHANEGVLFVKMSL